MNLARKAFLRHAMLGTAGVMSGACLTSKGGAAPDARNEPLPSFDPAEPEAFWRAVRAQYPLSPSLTYFNTGGLGPAVRCALDVAADTTRRLQERAEHGHGLLAGARETVARFFGVDAAEIAFVRNATEGNAIVAAGLSLRAGDEVIFESHAHPGGSFCWLQQATLRGIRVRIFEPAVGAPAENLSRIGELMTARTRVVQVSHVTAPTGIVLPVADLGRLCRERGVWFHVDGAQSAGMMPFRLGEIGCDSFATSGHKWLGAPHETGVLYVRRERLDEVAPTLVGAYSGDVDMLPGEFRVANTAIRYEYGTRNAAAILGLAEAVRFQERVGRDRIAQRGRLLAARVRAGLSRLDGVEILTPEHSDACAAMLTFRTARVPHDRLFSRLLSEHAIRCRPVTEQKLNALRVSTHCFNSPAECDALVAAVDKILRTA